MIPLFLLNIAGSIGAQGKAQRILASALGIIGAALLIAAAFFGLRYMWTSYINDREATAVRINSAEVTAAAEQRNREAYEVADANMAATVERDQQNDREIRNVTTKADNSAVGPGTSALLRKLREQQSAGKR